MTDGTVDPEKKAASQSDQPQQPLISDWDGPDDPGNPRNWSPAFKAFNGSCVAGVAFVVTFASSVFSPGIDAADSEFGSSHELGTLAYALFILGLALGAPLAGPLSETIGRRSVFWYGTPFFAAFALGSGFSNNIAALLVQRFLCGLFGSASLSIGAVSIADIWAPEDRNIPMALYSTAPFFAPAVAPLVGGAVTQYLSWRWTSWMIVFVGLISFFIPAPFMRETYKRAILDKRAKERGVRGPSALIDHGVSTEKASYMLRTVMLRPMHMYLTEPVCTAFITWVAFNVALLYAFFSAFQTVYQTYYGFDLVQVGLTFLGVAVGVMMGLVLIILFDRYQYQPQLRQYSVDGKSAGTTTSKIAPEHRLPIAMLGGPLITGGLFLFGWSAYNRVHWIAPVIGEALFGCGIYLIFMAATQYVLDVYGPLYGGSAQAANTFMRYLMGFVFPLFATQMFKGLGVQWACTLLGCVSALLACVPFVLYRWGPRLRMRIKYEIGD